MAMYTRHVEQPPEERRSGGLLGRETGSLSLVKLVFGETGEDLVRGVGCCKLSVSAAALSVPLTPPILSCKQSKLTTTWAQSGIHAREWQWGRRCGEAGA